MRVERRILPLRIPPERRKLSAQLAPIMRRRSRYRQYPSLLSLPTTSIHPLLQGSAVNLIPIAPARCQPLELDWDRRLQDTFTSTASHEFPSVLGHGASGMHVNCLSVESSLTPVKSLWQARPGGNTRMSVRYASEFNKPLDTLPWPATPHAPHVLNISRQRRSLSQYCARRLNKRLRIWLPVSTTVCVGSE